MAGSTRFFVALSLTLLAVAPCCLAKKHNKVESACAKEHKVDVKAAEMALFSNKDVTENILCYARCALKGYGGMDANNVLKEDLFLAKFPVTTKSVTVARGILNKCKEATTEPQSCGYAYNIAVCFIREIRALIKGA